MKNFKLIFSKEQVSSFFLFITVILDSSRHEKLLLLSMHIRFTKKIEKKMIVLSFFFSDGKYLGCFRDGCLKREIERDFHFAYIISPDRCNAECQVNGFSYAGLQNHKNR